MWSRGATSSVLVYKTSPTSRAGTARVGIQWVSVGGGVNHTVRAMTVWDGRLAIGGTFGLAGGSPATRLAIWDGQSLTGVESEFGISEVNALAAIDGSLFLGGHIRAPFADPR